ncbi:uncharacterized protein [Parasteatoda tepidariorum]|uniref:uncharacterized protein n=1 Tax=Parasteatoda tepidariorum TaxID=114398 RepID=UPI001C72627E|nr:uncharacterized protein LOC107436088 [Parasteatoda tepidariorum]XP_015903152.2 uncharacterized protein LOC107436088 [Parasteatoda tepidariorum]XP_042898521.1 uncharacterized protein LOC107436088 [Parasteatoda tepidariorum]XP_042898522.1 uncharacterized protein LOC107436088 [Parasteatoda tepidariorum]
MASDNIHVSALVRQLEELKKKKARNIKKLKRKSGKIEVLNDRKVFGELNLEHQFLNPIQSVRNEIKYFKDGVLCLEKNETDSDNSKQSPNRSECPGEDSEPNQKRLSGDHQIIGHSEYENYSRVDSEHDRLVGRKRSATDFQNDETISHSKKTKIIENELSEASKEQRTSSEAVEFSVLEKECMFSRQSECPIPDNCDNKDSDICKVIISNRTEVSNLLPTSNSEDLPLEDKVVFENLKDNTCSNSYITKNVVPVDTDFSQNVFVEENDGAEKSPIKAVIIQKRTLNEGSNDLNSCNNVIIPVQCDSNVIEVADTEIMIAHQSQDDIICHNKNCEPLEKLDEIDDQEVKNKGTTVIEIAETEEMVNKDFPTDVGGFEEVATEEPTSAPLLPQTLRHPSINCTFTDEEDETADLENSLDVDKLLEESDCDELDIEKENFCHSDLDEKEIEEENLCQSDLENENLSQFAVSDSEVSSPFSKRKKSNYLYNDVDKVTKMAPYNVIDVSAESEILTIPETEWFDFASYSNKVEDIAENVSIETDYADNCDKAVTVDNCHNNCIETDCNVNSNSEPVYFIAKIDKGAVANDRAIDSHTDSVRSIIQVKHDNKGICIGIEGTAISDCREESDCFKADESALGLNNCLTTGNCHKETEISNNNLPVNNCDSEQNFEEAKNGEQLSSQHEFETDSFGTEDFLKFVNLQQMPFSSDSSKSSGQSDKVVDSLESSLKFQCCFQSENINEEVSQLKVCYFNSSHYLFIQHQTWIQVWKQEDDSDWMKIFAHQVDDLQFKELCLSQSESYLVLVMLLNSKQSKQCLQFLVFERESRLIKLMEHTHWFENSENQAVFLCGLEDLKFASAQGNQDGFKVYSHSFSCLEDNPRLLTTSLGSAADSLHSLCRIDKLPNALLGVSKTMLYVWHLLEARLVTSVHVQTENSASIEDCVWTTVENGLVFLMATHTEEKESSKVCQLLAANLATGFCEVVQAYTLQPAKEISLLSNRKMNLVYSEPFLAASTEDGAFIWFIDDEYCCASLMSPNYSSIAIAPSRGDSFLVVVGCSGGCVNCYEMKYG